MHTSKFQKLQNPILGLSKNIEKRLSPSVLRMNEGHFRLYFAEQVNVGSSICNTSIRSARSENGQNWILEDGSRIDCNKYGFDRVLSPSVIDTGSGFRMMFEGRRNGDRPSIYTAYSGDGLSWELQNKVGLSVNKSTLGVGSPCLIYDDGLQTYRIYFHVRTQNACNIWTAKSKDGMIFVDTEGPIIIQEKESEAYSIYSPFVFRDGSNWQMLYAGWSIDPIVGRIFHAESSDGVHWEKTSGCLLEPSHWYDVKHCSEPSITNIEGVWVIFYECCDASKRWRIASAWQTEFNREDKVCGFV